MKNLPLVLSVSSCFILQSSQAELINLGSLTASAYKSPPNTRQDYNPQPTFLAAEGGYEIRMVNSWKRFRLKDADGSNLTANVGPNTVLSFDVKFGTGNGIPEFAAVTLDSDGVFDNGKGFLLHVGDHLSVMSGNATFPQGVVDPSWYYEIEDGWFRYSIPVGEELAPYSYNSLALVSDDDGSTGNGKNGYVQFRNVRIYENEGAPSFSSVYVGEDVWVDGDIILGGELVDHVGNPLISGGPNGLELHRGFTLSPSVGVDQFIAVGGGVVSLDDTGYAGGLSSGFGNSSQEGGGRNFFGSNNKVSQGVDFEDGDFIYSDVVAIGSNNEFELSEAGNFRTSVAIGDGNELRRTSGFSLFLGAGNIVPLDVVEDLDYAYAFGVDNRLRNSGWAIGLRNEIIGTVSQALGWGLNANSYACTYVGNFNEIDIVTPPSATVSRDEDPVFVVGNGTSDAERSDALTILRNGDVIISKRQGDISMGIFGSSSN